MTFISRAARYVLRKRVRTAVLFIVLTIITASMLSATAVSQAAQQLVDPEYQGRGIAGHLVGMVKQRYHDYLYIEVMPEESKNATFYEKHGFHIMEDGVAMQICNPGERH